MTQVVLIGLAVAWVVVLAPDAARLFRPRRRVTSSMDEFRRQLDSLGRAAPAAAQMGRDASQGGRKPKRTPGLALPNSAGSSPPGARPPVAMPMSPQAAAERRRDVTTLLVLCLAVAVAGTAATRSVWSIAVSGAIAALTVTFLLLAWRRRRRAPSAQVHYLPFHQSVETDAQADSPRRQAN